MSRTRQRVTFHPTGEARHPWAALVDGERWTLRLNEFPESPSLYSLLVEGEVVEELLDWPDSWARTDGSEPLEARPPGRDDDAHEKAEFEREEAQLARTRDVRPSKLVK